MRFSCLVCTRACRLHVSVRAYFWAKLGVCWSDVDCEGERVAHVIAMTRLVPFVRCDTGTRLDWVVSCSAAGTYQISDVGAPVTNSKIFVGVIAYIEVSGTAVQSADVPTSLASVTKPYYLQDQTEAKVDSEHSINFSQVPCRC